MNRYVLTVDGMACGMCEAHVNDAVRAAVPDAKKVQSSHTKGETVFLTDLAVDEEALKKAVSATGYEVKAVRRETVEKRKWPWQK